MSLCQFCDKTKTASASFEDNIYSALIVWLRDTSCLPWFRVWPSSRRPDGEQDGVMEKDGQYGMIFIREYEQFDFPKIVQKTGFEVGIDEITVCNAIEWVDKITVDFVLYRETGEKVRETQPVGNQIMSMSAGDALRMVRIMLQLDEYSSSLSLDGNTIELVDSQSTNITVDVETREQTPEFRATMTCVFNVCRAVSFVGEAGVVCVEDCDGNPLCIKKPDCDE